MRKFFRNVYLDGTKGHPSIHPTGRGVEWELTQLLEVVLQGLDKRKRNILGKIMFEECKERLELPESIT